MSKFFNIYYWIYFYVYYKSSDLINHKQYDKAIKLINAFLQKKKFATEAIYYELGRAYLEKKEYKLAAESFSISVQWNLCDDVYKSNTYFYLGLTYYESGNFQGAAENFQKSIHIKERLRIFRGIVISLPNLYCYLGRAYVKLGKPDEAFKIFNKGLEYEPNNDALQRELTILGIG